MSLIRGRSDSAGLEKLTQLIHLAFFSLRTWIYWEYIPSKSNWADAISRLGADDPWFRSHGFSPHTAAFPLILWRLLLRAVIRLFEFL